MNISKKAWIITITILIAFFYTNINYSYDIKLAIDYRHVIQEGRLEALAAIKSNDFLDIRYTNFIMLDNFFDKKCVLDLKDYKGTYKDVRSIMSQTYGRDNYARLKSASAEIVSYDDETVKTRVNGKLCVLGRGSFEFDNSNTEEFEYEVTFKKKFLFVWKAVEFKSDSKIIEKVILDTLLED